MADTSKRTNFIQDRLGVWQYLVGLAVLIFILGLAVWGLGKAQRADDYTGKWEQFTSGDSLSLLDARQGVALMLRKNSNETSVVARVEGQSTWLLISQDDTTVSNPALSPTGQQIAYLSQQAGGQIVIVPVYQGQQYTISRDSLTALDLGVLKFCDWTPLVWHPTAKYLAFIACQKQEKYSIVVVADLTVSPPTHQIVADSLSDSDRPRQLHWLDDQQLIFTLPQPNGKVKIVVCNKP